MKDEGTKKENKTEAKNEKKEAKTETKWEGIWLYLFVNNAPILHSLFPGKNNYYQK